MEDEQEVLQVVQVVPEVVEVEALGELVVLYGFQQIIL